MKVEYYSDNSGGRWWLNDEQWKALEDAGWEVEWGGMYFCHSRFNFSDNNPPTGHVDCWDGKGKENPCQGHRCFSSYEEIVAAGDEARWLGSLAKQATRQGLPLREAAEEWERVTGMSSTDAGCPCCGLPHNFTEYDDDGDYVASGPEASYQASW